MRKSKFVGKYFDNGWHCTRCNLAANWGHGTKHNRYWYAFERINPVSNDKEWFRVEGHVATKIYKGLVAVQDLYMQSAYGKPTATHEINIIRV